MGDRSSSEAKTEWLTALIAANSADLLSYFLRRVDVAEDAADLLSETMVDTWRSVRSLPQDDERARMWMFGTARRVLANHHRGLRRKSALTERLRNEIHHAQEILEPEPDDFALVRQVVNDLSPKLGDVVKLVHWDGFSLVEAAVILGVSPSTARSRHALAKLSLQESLSSSREFRPDLSR